MNTPVWFNCADGKIGLNSAHGRTKARKMTLGSKAALSILDPDTPDRYAQLRVTRIRIREDEIAAADID